MASTTVAFDTGAGSQTLNYELGKLDLSRVPWLRATLKATKADTDAGDLADVYVQCRGLDGTWMDRIHFTQLTGDMSPSSSAPEVIPATLQAAGSLSDDEEESESSGSAGASRLAAGTVRNGAFPGVYRDSSGRGASWRVQIVVTEAGTSNADFEGQVIFEWDDTP